jgi:hypothetical protein
MKRANTQVVPYEMINTPRPHQIGFLDKILHVEDPDVATFVDRFSIPQIPHDCDMV